MSDGGGLGSACTTLDQCAGNPLCGLNQTCTRQVICADGQCASAGGAPAAETVDLAFGGSVAARIDYVQVNVFAPQRVGAGTLDCPTLLGLLDAGAQPGDLTQFNAFFPESSQRVHPNLANDPTGGIWVFPLPETASGKGRLLLLDAYESAAYPDGGDPFLGQACAAFDDDGPDAGTVGITVSGP